MTRARTGLHGLDRGARRGARNVLGALALLGAACLPSYAAVEFEAVSTPPVSVTIRGTFIEMPAGIAAVVRARPISDNRADYDSDAKIDFFSRDSDVFKVYRRPSRREFVFVAVAEGSTCVEVEIDGVGEDCIDVEVIAPAGD